MIIWICFIHRSVFDIDFYWMVEQIFTIWMSWWSGFYANFHNLDVLVIWFLCFVIHELVLKLVISWVFGYIKLCFAWLSWGLTVNYNVSCLHISSIYNNPISNHFHLLYTPRFELWIWNIGTVFLLRLCWNSLFVDIGSSKSLWILWFGHYYYPQELKRSTSRYDLLPQGS